MKAARTTQLLISLLLVGCTQGKEPGGSLLPRSSRVDSNILPVAEVQVDGQTTQVLQMTAHGGALYVSGKAAPAKLGFSKWDISSDPESPFLSFMSSTDIEAFSPMRKWVTDWYASGALAIFNGFAFTSGSVGASTINMNAQQFPKEVYRYPPLQEGSDIVPRDERFVYKGMALHPTQPILYGFRQQDYAVNLQIAQDGKLNPVAQTSYGQPGQSVCCAMGATTYNGHVFAAMRTRLWVYDIDPTSGYLGSRRELKDLQAVSVKSTQRFLYVQHNITTSIPGSSSHPSGIYVYDAQGNTVNMLPISPLVFAVSEDDNYLYANMDNERINVYKIYWTNSY